MKLLVTWVLITGWLVLGQDEEAALDDDLWMTKAPGPNTTLNIATYEMDQYTGLMDACNNACSRGSDTEDIRAMQEWQSTNEGQFATVNQFCVIRCRSKLKAPSEVGYVAQAPSKPSKVLREYLQCAMQCSPGLTYDILHDHVDALRALSSCGVVHLRNAFPLVLFSELAEAFRAIPCP